MRNESPEVTAYIENAPEFARPILKRIRKAFHTAVPDVQETIKWRFPHFEHKGVLGSMAAFKGHVSWGFWKAKLMSDPHKILEVMGETSMGGTKVTDVSDLPPDKVLIEYVREAARLNEEGVKVEAKPKRTDPSVDVPQDLQKALKGNAKAKAEFAKFSPSHKREYVEWITEAKQEATRQKRLAQAMEWIAEGKPRNWKYMKR